MFIVASISSFFYDIVLCFNDAHHDENNDGDNRKDKLDTEHLAKVIRPLAEKPGEFEKFWNPKEKFIKRMDIAIICGNAFACVGLVGAAWVYLPEAKRTGLPNVLSIIFNLCFCSYIILTTIHAFIVFLQILSKGHEEQIKMMERRVYDVMKVKVEFGYEKLTEELTKHENIEAIIELLNKGDLDAAKWMKASSKRCIWGFMSLVCCFIWIYIAYDYIPLTKRYWDILVSSLLSSVYLFSGVSLN